MVESSEPSLALLLADWDRALISFWLAADADVAVDAVDFDDADAAAAVADAADAAVTR